MKVFSIIVADAGCQTLPLENCTSLTCGSLLTLKAFKSEKILNFQIRIDHLYGALDPK
jgi:hypothetical protein